MDIREQQNIFSLFFNSFRLLNRAGTAIFVLIFSAILLYAMIAGLAKMDVPLFLVKIMIWPLTIFFSAVFLRQLGCKAQNEGESIAASCSASVFPTIYSIILILLLSVALVALSVLMAASRSAILITIAFLLILFFYFRLCFVPAAIVLREQGPIASIIYSWQLTGHRWGITLGMFLILCFGPSLLISAIIRALYVGIPLFFADSFNITALSAPWYIAGAVLLVLIFLFWILLACFYVLVFLNVDFGENRGSYTPTPEVHLTEEPTQIFGADNNVLPPGIGKPVTEQDLQNQVGVQVTHAAFQSAEPETINQHLDKVYQPPKSEDIVQYADEDRMPTILFDDEMAKQIEANQQMWAKQTKHEKTDNPDDNQTSIKMSK